MQGKPYPCGFHTVSSYDGQLYLRCSKRKAWFVFLANAFLATVAACNLPPDVSYPGEGF